MTGALPLIAAVCATAAAQLSFKAYFLRDQRVWVLLAIALFCTATVMSYIALHSWSLGAVYMATGLTYVLVLAGAATLLGEVVTSRQAVATLLIISGVIVFNV